MSRLGYFGMALAAILIVSWVTVCSMPATSAQSPHLSRDAVLQLLARYQFVQGASAELELDTRTKRWRRYRLDYVGVAKGDKPGSFIIKIETSPVR